MFLSQRQSCASTPPTPANTSPTATAPTSSATTSWRRRLMVRMGGQCKSRWGWLFCRTPRRRRPRPCPALAGQRRAGQRRASPQEEDERIAAYEKHSLPSGKYDFKAAVYHHILNKVCICASDHGWVPIVLYVCVSPVRRFIIESVCVSQLSSCHAPLLQRPPTQNVDHGACAPVLVLIRPWSMMIYTRFG